MHLIDLLSFYLFLVEYFSPLHSALLQRDGEFDESDTLVSDLVATLQVLLAHPSIDLSVLVDPVRDVFLFHVPHHRFLCF